MNQVQKNQNKNLEDSSESISSIIDNNNEIEDSNKFSNMKNKSSKY